MDLYQLQLLEVRYHRRRRQGDRGRGHARSPPQKKFLKIFFSGKCREKFAQIVNFSYIYFRAKMSCPPKLTELLRLCEI